MRHPALFAGSLATAVAASIVAVTTPPARACGGFFCNAQTQTVIVQAGERILFAPHDGLVTMHIEIVYQGDPTEFGWILPLADLPMDSNGQPLPLDKAVEVGSQSLFPTLQLLTDPVFALNRDPGDTSQQCAFPSAADTSSPQDTGSFADANGPDTPPVVVLQEAEVGPYDAQLIQAERSDALYAWLGEHGYLQDPKAQPILDHYVGKGFKFLGIRLQSGKSTGDLRPLAITLGENAPCVPLVLTQIAATPDMPILVWVLGPARAVPKNFIHAVIDERAFGWPGAPTYQQQLSQALDEAGRRAWVTEYAGPADIMRGTMWPSGLSSAELARATSLGAALQALNSYGLAASDPDVQATLRAHVPMPEGLTGYPYGNCYLCSYCPEAEAQCAAQGLPNAEHVTTDGEFYNYLEWWAAEDEAGRVDLGIDVAALVTALQKEVVTPRRNLETLITNAKTLTRFYTLMDPDEMSRDPVFAFNPDLPDVSNQHTATWRRLGDCDDNRARVTYPDGTVADVDCGFGCGFGAASIGPLEGTKTLLYPEVLDEEGEPIPFDPAQAEQIDGMLEGAMVGFPSLPVGFEPNRPTLPSVGTNGGGGGGGDGGGGEPTAEGGCVGASASSFIAALAALAALSFSLARARRRAAAGDARRDVTRS